MHRFAAFNCDSALSCPDAAPECYFNRGTATTHSTMLDVTNAVHPTKGHPSPKSVVGLLARDLGNLIGHLNPINPSKACHGAEEPWSPEKLLQKVGTACDTEGPVHGGKAFGDPWSSQLRQTIGTACDTEDNVHGGQAFGAHAIWASPLDRRRKVSFLLEGALVVPRDTSPPSVRARHDEPADPSPKVVCKLDGRVAWVNAAWTRLSGYSQEEIMGDDLLQKMHGPATDTAIVIVLMHHLARQQPYSAELVCYDRYGLPFKHTLRVAPIASPGSARLVSVTSDAVLDAALETSEHVPYLGCGDGGEEGDAALSGAGRDAMWLWETGDLASSPLAAALATAPTPAGNQVRRRSRTHHCARRSNICSDDESNGGSNDDDESIDGGIAVRPSQPWRIGDGGALAPEPPARPYEMQTSPLASLGWRDTSSLASPRAGHTTLLTAAVERSGTAAVARKHAPLDPIGAEPDELWLWKTADHIDAADEEAVHGGQAFAPGRPPVKPFHASRVPPRSFAPSPPPRPASPHFARARRTTGQVKPAPSVLAPLLPAFADPPLDGRHWFMPPDGPLWSKPSAAAAPPQPAPLSYSNEKPNMPTPHVSSVEVL